MVNLRTVGKNAQIPHWCAICLRPSPLHGNHLQLPTSDLRFPISDLPRPGFRPTFQLGTQTTCGPVRGWFPQQSRPGQTNREVGTQSHGTCRACMPGASSPGRRRIATAYSRQVVTMSAHSSNRQYASSYPLSIIWSSAASSRRIAAPSPDETSSRPYEDERLEPRADEAERRHSGARDG